MAKVPVAVVHYGKNDPETHRGGVEAFARNLRLVFEDVAFMHPETLHVARVRDEGRMVICDNQWVVDWPDDVPVVGFQHGVAAVKARATGNRVDRKLAKAQARAARRPNTIWVACAQWIARTFGELHGNAAQFVIHHQVDLDRFDGRRDDVDARLVLHDARGKHKGEALMAGLVERFKGWKLEPLACPPEAVPDRMRRARAFVHLSRYEGNSIVCNEAMAMNLPLFATRVGLMQDDDRPRDVWLVDPDRAFSDRRYLDAELAGFLQSLDTRAWEPRAWILEHAHIDVARKHWNQVRLAWESLG
jgi:glycosyltransferase involved in cell wall biosynthesis